MNIGRRYTFAAGHHLPNHNGMCRRQHGHNYVLEVEVRGPIKSAKPSASDEGMVIDFKDLDQAVKVVLKRVDHFDFNLDNIMEREDLPTTAENILMWMVGELETQLFNVTQTNEVRLSRVRLWETERSYAEWRE